MSDVVVVAGAGDWERGGMRWLRGRNLHDPGLRGDWGNFWSDVRAATARETFRPLACGEIWAINRRSVGGEDQGGLSGT